MYLYCIYTLYFGQKQTNMNYENSKIYKLVNDIDDKIYVGSTATTLAKRLHGHKNSAKRKPDIHVYRHLNTVGWDNVRIVLIESIVVQNKDQLRMNEQRYIDELRPELNKNAAYVNCQHGNNYQQCKDCGGSQICEHNRMKPQCKDCGGSQICEHNRQKSTCKDCCGSQICEHNRQKSTCKDCCGSQICEHNRQKSTCKECGGSRICKHNRHKPTCRECGGNRICEHNRHKPACKECYPKRYHCEACNKSLATPASLSYHNKTVKHIINFITY
jgi:group I intron endonuclease